MTSAEANRRQAEIWLRDVHHENDMMRPVSGDEVCQSFYNHVLAFFDLYGVGTYSVNSKSSVSNQ